MDGVDASRESANSGHMSRLVRILCYPGIQPLDVVGPHEVFAGATRHLEDQRPDMPGYRAELVSSGATTVRSDSGLALVADRGIDASADHTAVDTLVVPGGFGVYEARDDARLIAWLREAAAGARRVAAVCTGAFLLAEAGVLDGCRVTTHWTRAERLQREYPTLDVDPDPVYIEAGGVWTSAGITAGTDLALALVEADHGAQVAQVVSRWLVMFLRRPGGQSQFATPSWSGGSERAGIRAARELIHDQPGADLSLSRLATHARMSQRNFTRVFTRDVGCPPGRYVERVRVDAARHLLETTVASTADIAQRCGLGTAETLRRAFIRHLGVPPRAYRERFTVAPAQKGSS